MTKQRMLQTTLINDMPQHTSSEVTIGYLSNRPQTRFYGL